MHSSAKATTVPCSIGWGLLGAVSFTLLVLMVLVWSTAAADVRDNTNVSDSKSALTADSDATAANETAETLGADTETVTMSIPLEEGAVIDVEAPPMGLKIEKWDGDDVLLIVEKTKRTKAGTKTGTLDPVNIQVSRKGKDVRIETTGGQGWEQSGMDLSFRIVLPEQYGNDPIVRHTRTETAARLTGVLWRALHNEALAWLTR